MHVFFPRKQYRRANRTATVGKKRRAGAAAVAAVAAAAATREMEKYRVAKCVSHRIRIAHDPVQDQNPEADRRTRHARDRDRAREAVPSLVVNRARVQDRARDRAADRGRAARDRRVAREGVAHGQDQKADRVQSRGRAQTAARRRADHVQNRIRGANRALVPKDENPEARVDQGPSRGPLRDPSHGPAPDPSRDREARADLDPVPDRRAALVAGVPAALHGA